MTVRRRVLILTASTLLAVAAVEAGGSLRIRVGTVVPRDTLWHRTLEYIAQDWRRIVGPELQIRIIPGLGDEHDLVMKARSGQFQMVGLSSVGLSRIDRAVSCLQVPMMLESYEELDYVRDRLAPELEQRIEGKGFKVLHWADGGWVYLFSRSPVRTPDELRRMRLYTSAGDPVTEGLYKDLGFNAVPTSSTDVVVRLQRRTLDAFAIVPLYAQLEWFRLAPHLTDLPWTPLIGGTVIKLDSWQSLPGEKRGALLQAAREAGLRLRDEIRRMDREAITQMRKRGLTLVELDAAAKDAWRREAAEAYPRLRGEFCEPEIFDKVLRLRDEIRAKRGTAPHSGHEASRRSQLQR